MKDSLRKTKTMTMDKPIICKDGIHCDIDCPYLQPQDGGIEVTAKCALTGNDLMWHDFWIGDCDAVPEPEPEDGIGDLDIGEIKDCPFCGSKAEHESTVTQETIRCTLCPATMHTSGSSRALLAMWNFRQPTEEE